jgi:hypothetical protein
MADLWTDDAVRFGPDTAADVGKQAIRETNERSTARPMLTFVPELATHATGTAVAGGPHEEMDSEPLGILHLAARPARVQRSPELRPPIMVVAKPRQQRNEPRITVQRREAGIG